MSAYLQHKSWEPENETNSYRICGDPLAAIYNEGHWRINKVSPLNNLQYNAVKLKQYATKIRHGIVSSVLVNTVVKYTVQFVARPRLKYTEEDSDCLEIIVSIENKSKNAQVVYTGILLSWGVSSSLDKAIHLPYLLERGEDRVGTAVKATIQTMFDCVIKQFTFTELHLLLLGFSLLEYGSPRNTDQFVLSYTNKQDHKNKFSISFDIGDVYNIYDRLKRETSNKTELVIVTYEKLRNQIMYMSELDISMLIVCDVQLPKAEVKMNGSVKMKTPEMVHCVLTVLNDIYNNCEL